MLAHIVNKTNDTLTVFAGVRVYTARKDHPNYSRIVAALADQTSPAKERKVIKLLDVPYVLNKFTKGVAEVRNGEVYFNGEVMHDEISRRVIEVMNSGLPFQPMLRFLENVLMNPSERSRKELYGFLEHRALPITEDGCFLGYKKVRDDYMDFHSGKFNNSVGQKHSMPRENVDPDCRQHCSTGFHVGTIEYADKQFHSGFGKLVIVKVHPAHAVSVPNDHSCQKIRVCEYEVVADYIGDLVQPVYGNKADAYVPETVAEDVYDDDVEVLDADPVVVEAPVVKAKKPSAAKTDPNAPKRDEYGRFAPKKR